MASTTRENLLLEDLHAREEHQRQNHPDPRAQTITHHLFTSHFLSAWNSRLFEFGAPLFLATIYPDTLFYASLYALVRSLSATLFSSRVGAYIDRTDRLRSIRVSILGQRGAVVVGCVVLYILLELKEKSQDGVHGVLGWLCFGLSILLACAEKLANIGNTVAVERDWVVVICENIESVDRGALNASLRRIDLFCKLVAPVIVALLDAVVGTQWAVVIVLGLSALSAGVEYVAIAQVYHALPELGMNSPRPELSNPEDGIAIQDFETVSPLLQEQEDETQTRHAKSFIESHLAPWYTYITSSVFPASFALSLLYLTVLSTNVHWQIYMLTLHYSSLSVSLFRVLAVASELAATRVAPLLIQRIGPIRSGLWSINWQVLWLVGTVCVFGYLNVGSDVGNTIEMQARLAGAVLTSGIIASRLGLWGFDLSVQYLVQEAAPSSTRAAFSSCEIALQSFFELLSFLATIIFARPSQFVYPAAISCSAVVLAAACFAAFVRKERGHLVHWDRVRCLHCLGLEGRHKAHDHGGSGSGDELLRHVGEGEEEEVET